MKLIALNGSPRKKWNTATLLDKALEGAASQGAETELIHLYELNYKGCISCFACRLKNGASYGKCGLKDDLTPILEKIAKADALILGSPIYLGAVTGEMHSFFERLLYPYLVYDANYSTLFNRIIPTGFIYTYGASEGRMLEMGYDQPAKLNEGIMKKIFGASETLLVNDTYQFDDYAKYEASGHDAAAKARRRKEIFPLDCQKAFEMGVRFALPSQHS